jgi:hypothetical protein
MVYPTEVVKQLAKTDSERLGPTAEPFRSETKARPSRLSRNGKQEFS